MKAKPNILPMIASSSASRQFKYGLKIERNTFIAKRSFFFDMHCIKNNSDIDT